MIDFQIENDDFSRSPTRDAFSLRKMTIFIQIAPTYINPQQSNAKRVFFKENSHFLEDRPHLFFV